MDARQDQAWELVSESDQDADFTGDKGRQGYSGPADGQICRRPRIHHPADSVSTIEALEIAGRWLAWLARRPKS